MFLNGTYFASITSNVVSTHSYGTFLWSLPPSKAASKFPFGSQVTYFKDGDLCQQKNIKTDAVFLALKTHQL